MPTSNKKAGRVSDWTGEAKPWENPTLLPGNQVSFTVKYQGIAPGMNHDAALQVEQNRMNAMPDGYTFRSNTRREADYKITEQVPSTMKTEGQLNYKLDPGMYEPQPGMYDDVMASDPPMTGTTFTQCERKPIHITSPCKSENYILPARFAASL